MYIRVTVTPGAKKETFQQTGENRFASSVREKAEQNQANRRIVEIVAARFGIPEGKVRIISGHHSPRKMLSIDVEG